MFFMFNFSLVPLFALFILLVFLPSTGSVASPSPGKKGSASGDLREFKALDKLQAVQADTKQIGLQWDYNLQKIQEDLQSISRNLQKDMLPHWENLQRGVRQMSTEIHQLKNRKNKKEWKKIHKALQEKMLKISRQIFLIKKKVQERTQNNNNSGEASI